MSHPVLDAVGLPEGRDLCVRLPILSASTSAHERLEWDLRWSALRAALAAFDAVPIEDADNHLLLSALHDKGLAVAVLGWDDLHPYVAGRAEMENLDAVGLADEDVAAAFEKLRDALETTMQGVGFDLLDEASMDFDLSGLPAFEDKPDGI